MNENKQMTHHCLQVAPRTVGGEEPVKQKHNLLGVLIRRVRRGWVSGNRHPLHQIFLKMVCWALVEKPVSQVEEGGNKRKSKLQKSQETW